MKTINKKTIEIIAFLVAFGLVGFFLYGIHLIYIGSLSIFDAFKIIFWCFVAFIAIVFIPVLFYAYFIEPFFPPDPLERFKMKHFGESAKNELSDKQLEHLLIKEKEIDEAFTDKKIIKGMPIKLVEFILGEGDYIDGWADEDSNVDDDDFQREGYNKFFKTLNNGDISHKISYEYILEYLYSHIYDCLIVHKVTKFKQ